MDDVRRWDLARLPGFEAIEKPKEKTEDEEESEEDEEKKGAAKKKTKKDVTELDIEKNFDEFDIVILGKSGYPKPSNFFFDMNEECFKRCKWRLEKIKWKNCW